MGKRASKSTTLRALEGGRSNSLPKPDKVNEPKPRPKAPDIPKDIDPGAKRVWKRLGPKLERLGLLTENDGDMFASLVQIRSRLETIFRRQKKVARMIKRAEKDLDYDVLENLLKDRAWLYKEERLYLQLFRMQAAEFGLSPRGRVGLSVGTENDDVTGVGRLLD
jgi:phage terminase small subunit